MILKVNAIKIGMLHKADIIKLVTSFLKLRNNTAIVIDPVMVSKSGHKLLESDAVHELKHMLIPLATVITPNIPEAEELLDIKITNFNDMENAAKQLLNFGCKAVLLKGGHLDSNFSRDVLITKNGISWYEAPKISTKNTHGTGCTLSAAIASCLAHKLSIEQSVAKAKVYLTKAIQAGSHESIGNGFGPVHHFYHQWPALERI